MNRKPGTRNSSDKGKQKNNFAGTAKKRNRNDLVAQRSLVAVEEKVGGVAIVGKPQKHLSPRIINAHPQLAGMKRHDLDSIEQVKESQASVGRRESLDDVEAYLATDVICTNDLFDSPKIQVRSSNSLVNPG